MDAYMNRRLTGQNLGIGVKDNSGEFIGYVIAFGVGATEGEGLGNSVTAKKEVNPLGIQWYGLAGLQAETCRYLRSPLWCEPALLNIVTIQGQKYLIHPAKRKPLLEILQVHGDMNKPGGLQALQKGSGRLKGNPPAGVSCFQKFGLSLLSHSGHRGQCLRLNRKILGHFPDAINSDNYGSKEC